MVKHPHCLGNLWKGEWWIAKGTWHGGASQTSCHRVWVSFSWECLAGCAISGTENHLGSLRCLCRTGGLHGCFSGLELPDFLGEIPQDILMYPGLGHSHGVRQPAAFQAGCLILWQDIVPKSLWPEQGGLVQQTLTTSQKGSSRCSCLELLESKQGSRGVLE